MNTHMRRLARCLAPLASGFVLLGALVEREASSSPSAAADPREEVTRRANTPPTLGFADSVIEPFHDSETDTCGTTNIHIDSPVRAFEGHDNEIHLTVSDPGARGWQWTGSVADFTDNPRTAALDCALIMNGNTGNNSIPEFDQRTWIQSLYFNRSASTVYAYGHEDYFGTRTNEPECHEAGKSDEKPYCWYASIAVWAAEVPISGTHIDFSKIDAPPNHVAIYPHVQYPGHENTPTAGWIGYGTPSNIIRGRNQDGSLDDYHYMLAYTSSGYGDQPNGVCLFRSPDPSIRTSWRPWNGSTSSPAFTQQMVNPYTGTNSPCAVVNPATFTAPVRSLQWHEPSKHYVAIFRDGEGVWYATSTDLLTWNPAQLLLVSTTAEANYPVVIDFDGGGRGDDNFDRMYDNGKSYMFYRQSIEPGHTRIARRRLTVTNYDADPTTVGQLRIDTEGRFVQPGENTLDVVLINDARAAFSTVELSLVGPAGWSIEAKSPVRFAKVRGGEEARTSWRVTVPPHADANKAYLLKARAKYRYRAAGRVTKSAQRAVLVPPLLSADPASARLLPGSSQQFAVAIKGVVRDTLSGTLTAAAPEGWMIDPASQPFQLDSHGEIVVEQRELTVTVSPSSATGTYPVSVIATTDDGRQAVAGVSVEVTDHLIVDTQGSDYRETGRWLTSSLPGYNRGPTRYTSERGATATWPLPVEVAGEYEVAVWFPPHTSSTTRADYTVFHDGGETIVGVDQQATGGEWVELGRFRLSPDSEAAVRLSALAAGFTRADAVRLAIPRKPKD